MHLLAAGAVVLLAMSACTDSVTRPAVGPSTDSAGDATTPTASTTTSPAIAPTTSTGPISSVGSATSDAEAPAGAGPAPCVVESVPEVAGLDRFYTQGCNLRGFWVVAGEPVAPEAVQVAAAMADAFFIADPVLARAVIDSGVRLGVIGAEQRTTEMPEYRDLDDVFPAVDWDSRARGLGATPERPLVSAGEENILCLADDRYRGEDILLHEFAHALHLQGLAVVDPDFEPALRSAYAQALRAETWIDTYASTNAEEYWAEGVQSYFDRNAEAVPADGVHGPVDTRDELADADPALFQLIDQRFARVQLPPSCQESS